MSRQTKPWIKAEQKLGFRAARLPVALGAVQVVFGIVQAGCAARLLAAVLHLARGGGTALLYGVLFAAAALARAYTQMQAERQNFELGAAARRRLRGNVLSVLLALGPAGLRGRHSADLAATAVDRVEAMDGFHARWIPATQMALIGPALVGLVALLVDWRSGLILLVAGMFVPFAMAVAGIGAGVAAKRQFVAMTRLQVRFLDRIRGISTIVLAGRAADEARALGAAAKELRERTMRVLRVAFLSSTALDLAAAAALIFIVLRFVPVMHGALGLAPVALFMVLLVPEFFAPLRGFAVVYGDRMAVEAVADEFSALPPAPEDVPPADIRAVAAHGVTLAFENVGFAWDETRAPVLRDLSFKVGRGEILLLTGASGAGKSTIMDLILGFIAPQDGRVTINGAALETLVPAARTRMLLNPGQPVQNQQHGPPFRGAVQHAEELHLGCRIQPGAGLVQQQDRRIHQQRAGQRQAPPLPAGQCRPAFAQPSIQPLGQSTHHIGHLGCLQRRPEPCLIRRRVAQQQVVTNSIGEEMRGLPQISDAVAQPFGRQLQYIRAAKADLPAHWLNQWQCRAHGDAMHVGKTQL